MFNSSEKEKTINDENNTGFNKIEDSINNDLDKNIYEMENINITNSQRIQSQINDNNENDKINYVNDNIFIDYQDPDIIINPKYTNDIANEFPSYCYRQCITNKKMLRKEIAKNEYNEEYEENSINEELQTTEVNTPNNLLREEYWEEIIYLNKKNKNKISNDIKHCIQSVNTIIINPKNKNNQSDINRPDLFKSQKKHIEYVYKNNLNKIIQNYTINKSKTFVKQIKTNNIKHNIQNVLDYNIKIPKEDNLNHLERKNTNSSLNENLDSLKDNIENFNKYNSYNIHHNNKKELKLSKISDQTSNSNIINNSMNNNSFNKK